MKKEYILACVSVFCWSTMATVTKLMLGNFNSMQISLVTSFFAFLFLLIVSIFNGSIKQVRNIKLKEHIIMFLLGTLGMFLYHWFLYLGIDRMNASQAFIINYLWPVMSVVFGCIFLKEKMNLKKAVALLLSFAGVIAVTANGNLLSVSKTTLSGALFCVMAAVSYGLFAILNKKTQYDKILSMMFYCLASTIISLVYVVATSDYFTISFAEFGGLLWHGVLSIAVGTTVWQIALAKGDTAKVSNLAYITPFLSMVWAMLVLGESFSAYSLLGLVLIIAGIFVQM